MPWTLILTVGLKIFDLIYSNGKKKREAKLGLIKYVEGRMDKQRNSSKSRDSIREQRIALEKRRAEEEAKNT